jgi:hypothetical protein
VARCAAPGKELAVTEDDKVEPDGEVVRLVGRVEPSPFGLVPARIGSRER